MGRESTFSEARNIAAIRGGERENQKARRAVRAGDRLVEARLGLAMAGLGVDKMLRHAGHDDNIDTTMGYVKLAEDWSRSDPPSDPLWKRSLFSRRKPVPEEGVEGAQSLDVDVHSQTSDDGAPGEPSATARTPVDTDATGPAFGPASEVEAALARALDSAAAAGRYDVVVQLARELEARRLAWSPNVVPLDASRSRRR